MTVVRHSPIILVHVHPPTHPPASAGADPLPKLHPRTPVHPHHPAINHTQQPLVIVQHIEHTARDLDDAVKMVSGPPPCSLNALRSSMPEEE